MKPKSLKLPFAIVLTLTVLAAVLAPAAEAGDHRLRVSVDEPFVFQGELHSPNTVTVREVGDYTPNAVFAEIWVGNECLGRMLAEVEDASSPAAEVDSVLFTRSARGQLVLVGMSFRGEQTRRLMLPSSPSEAEPVGATVASLVR